MAKPWRPARPATGQLRGGKRPARSSEPNRARADGNLSLLDHLPHMVSLFDPSGRPTYFNRRHSEYFGLPAGDLDAWSRAEKRALHPDDVGFVSDSWDKTLQSGRPLEIEHRLRRFDGEYRWHLCRREPVLDAGGRGLQWLGTHTDIHEQKQLQLKQAESIRLAEEAGRISEERFKLAMAATGVGVWDVDPETQRPWRTPSHDQAFGYDDYLPDRDLDFFFSRIIPEDRERVQKEFLGAMSEGRNFHAEFRYFHWPDEQVRWMGVDGHTIRDPEGKVTRFIGTNRDITEQVGAREVIRESEQRFKQIANALPSIVWTAEAEGTIDWFNERWHEYTGLPSGTKNEEAGVVHPDDYPGLMNHWADSVKTGEPANFEFRVRRKSDGQFRWHLSRAVPIRDAQGRVQKWVGSDTDIHDQRALLARLEEERIIREQFVATLTHDLRTPLTAARMSAQLAGTRMKDPAQLQKMTGRIIECIDRADHLIRDMLDMNRVRAGEKLSVEICECEVTEIAGSVLEELSSIHGDRFVLEAPVPLRGNWSCNAVRRILENLCSNAVKYGSRERPITIRLERDGERNALISVLNWGTPIPSTDLEAIFDPYRRTQSAQMGDQKGWGLGLSLVKGLAEAHGGKARVESSLERGTIFTVQLPAG